MLELFGEALALGCVPPFRQSLRNAIASGNPEHVKSAQRVDRGQALGSYGLGLVEAIAGISAHEVSSLLFLSFRGWHGTNRGAHILTDSPGSMHARNACRPFFRDQSTKEKSLTMKSVRARDCRRVVLEGNSTANVRNVK